MVSRVEVVLTASPVVSLQVRARGFQTSSATTGHSWYLWMAVSSTRWHFFLGVGAPRPMRLWPGTLEAEPGAEAWNPRGGTASSHQA